MNINQFEWESRERELVERAMKKKWEVQEISIKC